MLNIIVLLVLLAGSDIKPIIDLPGGAGLDEVFIHEAKHHPHSDDMSYGPQEYCVDCNEFIYVRDVNTKDTIPTNRILKFDSTGKFLLVIETQSVPSLDRVWFGPITIDPNTNDLIIAGSGIPKGVYEDPSAVPTSEIPCYMFRFSESGQLLKAQPVRCVHASFLLYNQEGRFYTKYVDGAAEFDQNLQFVKELPKSLSKGRGYSQWTNWIGAGSSEEYTSSNTRAGKFLIKLKHLKSDTSLVFTFYNPPHYSFGGFIEGEDRYGNIYLNARRKNYVRINPQTKKVAIVNFGDLGIPSGIGDVRHASAVSPNGNLYWAALLRGTDNHLRYHIYRITSDMFNDKECEVEIQFE